MEGKTHYERIVGGTEEEKSLASKTLQEAFDRRSKKLAEYEIEKTPEDLEILQKIEVIVDSIVARYGGEPKALPLDHIYILRPDSVLDMTEGRLVGGIHKPIGLKVGVEKGKSKLLFADILAHELFHLKSYKSARVGKSGEDVRLYRSGLSMIDKRDPSEEMGDEKEYFAMLEEAIVAECTKKLLDEISTDSVFSEEAQAIRTFRNWVETYYHSSGISEEKIKEFGKELRYIPDPQDTVERVLAFSKDEEQRQTYAAGIFGALYEKGEVKTVERYAERKKLYELLDKLVINSGGKFKNRDEVFEIFARANFSGNYLSLARTVEGILGKGSFRKLAEEFSVEPKKD
ncbi:MAG: hypothetical protein WAW33_02870 [Minisyncoccia bacterium]